MSHIHFSLPARLPDIFHAISLKYFIGITYEQLLEFGRFLALVIQPRNENQRYRVVQTSYFLSFAIERFALAHIDLKELIGLENLCVIAVSNGQCML